MDTANERIFYHAVALALRGDRMRIAQLKAKAATWEMAYALMREQELFMAAPPDPHGEFEKLQKNGITLVLFDDPSYPALLREIPDPPFGIYIQGAIPAERIFFSIVGTRRATPAGKRAARTFARGLAAAGFTIVSGLAFGIDAAGHEGALEAQGDGVTLAILANGAGAVYPHNHSRLAGKIIERGGALISEYPPGEPPYPGRFLERNRIVSGMSKGTLLIEAPAHSGALVTARLAMEQNRDVFALPGPAFDPNFQGSHALIRQGAELVTGVEHIFETYRITSKAKRVRRPAGETDEETLILKALEAHAVPLDIDKIIDATKLEPRIANRTISFLLMRDLIKETEEGYTI